MLAERKKRVKWSLNPRGNCWSQDSSKFGQRMLEKMGWKAGSGLGVNEQGITEHIKVAYKSDNKCIGFKEHGQEWIQQQSEFENLLAELSTSHNNATSLDDEKGNESLEEKSRLSRARVHYRKFTRGKDLSNRSTEELACILGVKKTEGRVEEERKTEDVEPDIGEVNNLFGITTVKGGSMNDYFSKIRNKCKSKVDEQMANGENNHCGDSFLNYDLNILRSNDDAECINLRNKKNKKIKIMEDENVTLSSNSSNGLGGNLNDEILSDFKLEKTTILERNGQEGEVISRKKRKKDKHSPEITEEENPDITNSKIIDIRICKKEAENCLNDGKNGISEHLNNVNNKFNVNALSDAYSSKERKIQLSNVSADDTKTKKTESVEFNVSEVNICKNKHKKNCCASNENDDSDILKKVESEVDRNDTNALKKKRKKKSEKLCEEMEEFSNGEILETVGNEIDTNIVKESKSKKKTDLSKINEMMNIQMSERLETEVVTSNINGKKKKKRINESDVIEVCEEVTCNINVFKNKKKKSAVTEETVLLANNDVLEIVENEMDKNSTNHLKKKRKNKSDGIEENEVISAEIFELPEIEMNTNSTNTSRKKNRKNDGLLEENEIILEVDDIGPKTDMIFKKEKRKCGNNEGVVSDINSFKKNIKKKSDMCEGNRETINNDILEIVKNEIDINNTNALKKKRKKKCEANEEITEDVENEINTSNISTTLKKKKKSKMNEEVINDEIEEVVKNEMDTSNANPLKKERKNKSIPPEEIEEVKLETDTTVSKKRKSKYENNVAVLNMNTCKEKQKSDNSIKTNLKNEIVSKLKKESKTKRNNEILNEEELNTVNEEDVPSSSESESVTNEAEEPGIIHGKHESKYRMENMKVSEFRKLLDPSLIDFPSSNLHKIKGYGSN